MRILHQVESGPEMCSDVTDTVNMCVGKLAFPTLNVESMSMLLNFNVALKQKNNVKDKKSKS